jgi:lipoxygenase
VVSHYLIGHACQEPYIIALMRNVSALHPVFKLMRPHFRYTCARKASSLSLFLFFSSGFRD